MMRRRLLVCASLAIMCAGAQAEDSLPRKLMHDPFALPSFAQPPGAITPVSAAGADASAAKETLLFDLRMVINAGSHSVVNVGGKILKLYEKSEGYQLVYVGNSKASFIKDGKRYELELNKGAQK